MMNKFEICKPVGCFKQYYIMSLLLVSIGMITLSAKSQVTLVGARCILTGVPYQYTIANKNFRARETMICFAGGKTPNGEVCINLQDARKAFTIIWEPATPHQIEIKTEKGSEKISMEDTEELDGGELDEREKQINRSVKSYTFKCSDAKGGSCKPIYSYQWQISDNQINWKDLSGATGKDLRFVGSVEVNTYFRRVVTEQKSGLIAYSKIALLYSNFE